MRFQNEAPVIVVIAVCGGWSISLCSIIDLWFVDLFSIFLFIYFLCLFMPLFPFVHSAIRSVLALFLLSFSLSALTLPLDCFFSILRKSICISICIRTCGITCIVEDSWKGKSKDNFGTRNIG